MNTFELHTLSSGAQVHFIGIGGISMSGLAEILLDRGFRVSGSDMRDTHITDNLRARGVEIYIGQCAANIKKPDIVVYSAAIRSDNEELCAAHASGAIVIDRATLLGAIMKLYKYPIAVAGTHGKTTTTSMLTHIALSASLDPTVSIGGELPVIGGNIRVGQSPYFICEACEYHKSFLRFFPLVNIILNIEADHLDYFRDLEEIQDTFRQLACLTPDIGAVVINLDDENTCRAVSDVPKTLITCSKQKKADYMAQNITETNGFYSFDVIERGVLLGTVRLGVAGIHNVSNALCAIAAARFVGVDFDAIAEGLAAFVGVGRRFETKGVKNGITVVDDYAHHPTEIRATLNTAKGVVPGRVWCVFQPHTYTRTKSLFTEFADALSDAKPLILDIYAAREKDTGLVSAKDLADAIPEALYFPSFEDCVLYIKEHAAAGDMLLTMGAGDVYRVGDLFLESLI